MKLNQLLSAPIGLMLALILAPTPAHSAGTLTPIGSPNAPIQVRDHHVDVKINNGFAMTEVIQTFFNPNSTDLEGTYAFPVPKSASLSEYTIYVGETEINGEVVAKDRANQIYEEEKSKGNDAGLAKKNSYQTFEFKVAKIPASGEIKIRFRYYQPVELDTEVGKYHYPLEDGGTDEIAKSFWVTHDKVDNQFTASVEVRLSYPVADLRVPGFESEAKIDKLDEGHYRVTLAKADASLNKDLVVYYRLAKDQPGRLDLLTYRADKSKPGTFMAVLTPGIDLKPLTNGADYVFVLDTSGSMQGKLSTLANGVSQALGQLRPQDRYRIVTFSDSAHELTSGWTPADQEHVGRSLSDVSQLQSNGSTNLYDGLELALKKLDNDRVTSVILVTDGVTNTGILDPKEFAKLAGQYDVRIFGFLMGNSSNWPLMRMIADASGGFYSAVSNSDDIIGQIVLAKSKITTEALHNAELKISGVRVTDVTKTRFKKIYRGQQLVIFGRYDAAGEAKVSLDATLSGADRSYSTKVGFPELDTENPEIERLWALARIEGIQADADLGVIEPSESKKAVEDLGVAYQLVTDETSMLVLSDEGFKRHGIDRLNLARTAVEHQAQAQRLSAPVRQTRADASVPMFNNTPAPSTWNRGGGAFDPLSALLLIGLAGLGAARVNRTRVE